MPGGDSQGYSAALGLHLRAEGEDLVFHDPATGQPIMTYEAWRDRAAAADARDRELEAGLRRRQSGS